MAAVLAATAVASLAGTIPAAAAAPTPAAFALAETHQNVPVPVTTSIGVAAVQAPAPVGSAKLTLDAEQQEQYWFWASGVEVHGSGYRPGEEITIADRKPDGSSVSWPKITADASGAITQRIRWYDIEPDDNRPPRGLHQISAAGSSGNAAAATLAVVADADDKLPVSVSTPKLNQDTFLRNPITITVTGLQPREKVLLNLTLPNQSAIGIGDNEPLRATSAGTFRYSVRAATASQPTGTWSVFVQGDSGATYGRAQFTVTQGAIRHADKTLATAPSIGLKKFADKSAGLAFTASLFKPFDAFEVTLTTPRGASVQLGTMRTNGEGVAKNRITGFPAAPAGRYRVEARSMTTGDYATRTFDVLDGVSPATPALTLPSGSITAASFASKGTTLTGDGFPASTNIALTLRSSDGKRITFAQGTDLSAVTDATGVFHVGIRSRATLPAGRYTLSATTGNGSAPTDYLASATLSLVNH